MRAELWLQDVDVAAHNVERHGMPGLPKTAVAEGRIIQDTTYHAGELRRRCDAIIKETTALDAEREQLQKDAQVVHTRQC